MAEQRQDVRELVEHLFRHEAGKLSATLARAFGLRQLDIVDDIVQDTLVAALMDWSFKKIPEDPTAWLHRVARNKALDHLRRMKRLDAVEERRSVEQLEEVLGGEINQHFLSSEIQDSELRMIFACCHPGIPPESQIALTLKTLCGFSVQEIANAFLVPESTIEKRLQRARKYFRDHDVRLEPPSGPALQLRLEPVLSTLYLLFNEGYKRSHSTGLIERDLCLEALRLALLVSHHFAEECSEAFALVSIMTFHAARFDARTDGSGGILLLADQDRTQWNQYLLVQGTWYFIRSDPGVHSSTYHFEAAIQYLYCSAKSFDETDWQGVLSLYRELYRLKPTPIVALHMSVSLARVSGYEEALALLEELPLEQYYLYHALRGEFLMKCKKWGAAGLSLHKAISQTKNEPERRLLARRIRMCEASIASEGVRG